MKSPDLLIGDYYSQSNNRISLQALSTISSEFTELIIAHNASRFLDLGCGSACVSRALLHQNDIPIVTFMDLSFPLVLSLNEDTSIPGRGTRNFCVADAQDLPFEHHSFDCILLSFVFHLLGDQGAVLRRLADLLAPSGLFLMLTYERRDLDTQIYSKYFPSYRSICNDQFCSTSVIRKSLFGAGFRKINVKGYKYSVEFENVESVVKFIRTKPYSIFHKIEPLKFDHYTSIFREKLIHKFGRGSVEYVSRVTAITAETCSN